jgi:hypothetical protein
MGFALFFVSTTLFIMLAFYMRNFLKSYKKPYFSMEAYQKEGRIINSKTGVVTGQIIPSCGAS